MLQFRNRFHGHGSLRFVYAHGSVVRSSSIIVKNSQNPHRKHSRFAVVVSKKVLRFAVQRNRVRRRIYEIIRHELPRLHSGRDVVCIVISPELISMPHDQLRGIIVQQFRAANLYK